MKKSLHVFLVSVIFSFINITFSYSNDLNNIYSDGTECFENDCLDENDISFSLMDPLVVSLACPATPGTSGNVTETISVLVGATTPQGMGAINFPTNVYSTIPPEAIDINVSLTTTIQTFGNSFLKELLMNIEAPGTFADAANYQPSTTNGGGTETYTIDYGNQDPSGLWDFTMFETTNDTGTDSEVTLTVSLTWTVLPQASDCDTIICDANSFILDTELPGLVYNWSTNETTQSITVTESGTYSVTVMDGTETAFDDITVIFGSSTETVDANICDGQDYVVGTNTYTTSGTFTDVLMSYTGCDSTIITNLIVGDAGTTDIFPIVCDGGSVTTGTNTYTMTGDYTDILQSSQGCDSTVITHLTVVSSIEEIVDTTICFGQTYNVGMSTYTTSGNYTDILMTNSGCDSTVFTNLIILPELVINQDITICFGTNYQIGNNTYTTDGNYTDTILSSTGCDSIVHTNLTILPEIMEENTITLCFGQVYDIGTNSYAASGDYTDILISNDGCDSTVITHLIILDENSTEEFIQICTGESYEIGTNSYTISGDFTNILVDVAGCDSTVITHLSILDFIEETVTAVICQGQTYVVGTSSYTNPGTYTDILQASNNCDSIVTLNLSFSAPLEETNFIQICNGQTYTEGTSSYSSSGTYMDFYTTPEGCDSTVTTVLNVVAQVETTNDISICDGTSYMIGVNTYNTAGTYTDILVAAGGCDSIVTTNLTIVFDTPSTQDISICFGESYSIGINSYSNDGIYTDVINSSLGCDSTVITNLTIIGNSSYNNDIQICDGDVYLIGNSTYSNSGIYTDVLLSSLGCDSTVITTLEVVITINTSETVSLCEGESHNSVVYNNSTTLVDEEISANGCDSIHTTTIIVSIDLEIDFIIQNDICGIGQGSITAAVFGGIAPYTYSWDSSGTSNPFLDELNAGNYTLTVTDANDCSVVQTATLTSTPSITIDYTISGMTCNGDNDGAIDLNILTGTAPYLFIWSGPNNFSAQSEDISNLIPGNYTIIIYDANGCGFGTSIEVAEPGPLAVDVITFGATALASVTGGTAPYQYSWSNGATTPSLVDVETGIYSVTIVDNNGCSTSGQGTVLFNTAITTIENLLSFNILPNPSDGRFVIDIEMSIATSLDINIYSLAGVNVYQNSFDESSIYEVVNLSHQSSGTYLLVIDDGKNRKVEKIVIVK